MAYRALSLGALLKRGEIELTIHKLQDLLVFDDLRQQVFDKNHDVNRRLQNWVQDEKIHPHLSDSERNLLDKALGTWSERTLIHVGWRTEALGIMLWALNWMEDIPPYDQQYEPDDVLAPLDVFRPTIDFLWTAQLRPAEELQARRDQAELWNWRSRATELERMGVRPPEGLSFREIIRATAHRAYANGQLDQLINDDFPAFQKAYSNLDEDEYALVSALAYERYFALNWICELTSEWDNLRVDS